MSREMADGKCAHINSRLWPPRSLLAGAQMHSTAHKPCHTRDAPGCQASGPAARLQTPRRTRLLPLSAHPARPLGSPQAAVSWHSCIAQFRQAGVAARQQPACEGHVGEAGRRLLWVGSVCRGAPLRAARNVQARPFHAAPPAAPTYEALQATHGSAFHSSASAATSSERFIWSWPGASALCKGDQEAAGWCGGSSVK